MQPLTPHGQERVQEIAHRYGVSFDAAATLLDAVARGNGTMAQFNHWELGGGGQWMRGGMTMVSDLFNHALKAKVDGLCNELSNLLSSQPFAPAPTSSFQSQDQGYGQQQSQGYGAQNQGQGVSLFVGGGSGNWWPSELGMPSTSGAQNDVRYAYFPQARRLAVQVQGETRVYDTLDHQIGGVSQQQGGGASVTFTSQYGLVNLADLPLVSPSVVQAPAWGSQPPPLEPAPVAPPPAPQGSAGTDDIFAKLERLAELRQRGVISEEDFAAKKADLLSRL